MSMPEPDVDREECRSVEKGSFLRANFRELMTPLLGTTKVMILPIYVYLLIVSTLGRALFAGQTFL